MTKPLAKSQRVYGALAVLLGIGTLFALVRLVVYVVGA